MKDTYKLVTGESKRAKDTCRICSLKAECNSVYRLGNIIEVSDDIENLVRTCAMWYTNKYYIKTNEDE